MTGKKFSVFVLFILITTSLLASSHLAPSTNGQISPLMAVETEITSLINGTNIFQAATSIQNIGTNTTLSDYSFRSAGSKGANATAEWLQNQFLIAGLANAHLESFNFTSWDLKTPPLLETSHDSSENNTAGQNPVESFEPEQFSWPTPPEGIFAQIVTLPLPSVNDMHALRVGGQIGPWGFGAHFFYDADTWSKTNLTDKIVLVGYELRWTPLGDVLARKMTEQPPAALIYTWWYDWNGWAPPYFTPDGGRSAPIQDSYDTQQVPISWISFQDGLKIRTELNSTAPLYARMIVNAEVSPAPFYNVVGTLEGSVDPNKTIVISSHYDSVMDPGFCDDATGTAGLIELARVFARSARQNAYKPPFTLTFVAFSGEELGLVGAVNYIEQHQSQQNSILAVINLDYLGGRTLSLTETFADERGLNIESIAEEAARDLNIQTSVVTKTSDQKAFWDPKSTDDLYQSLWQTESGIRNATRVESSIGIYSLPFSIVDNPESQALVWIHTSYDNSTTALATGWITMENLQSNLQVAALTTLRALSASNNQFILIVYGLTAVSVAIVGIMVFWKRTQTVRLLKAAANNIQLYITMKDAVYVIILTVIFLFGSYLFCVRVTRYESIEKGYPMTGNVQTFGAPYGFLGLPSVTSGPNSESSSIIVLLQGLSLDIAIYAVLAFVMVYSIERTRARLEYSAYRGER